MTSLDVVSSGEVYKNELNMFIPAVFYFLSSNKRLYPLKFKHNSSGKKYRISG